MARVARLVAPLLDDPGCRLLNTRTGAVLAERTELAADSKSRNRGLLGRDRLDPGRALIIVPCSSIHTFFMHFTIDVLFVKRDGQVMKCAHAVGPWRIRLAPGAYAAIEFPAGTLQHSGTVRGDVVEFVRQSASTVDR